MKICLLLGRKVMTNLDSILKSRDITLPTKVCLVKATVFPVVMYGCESWTIKKAEHRKIDAFELWCWRRLLRVPWTARRSNQSILEYCSLWGLKESDTTERLNWTELKKKVMGTSNLLWLISLISPHHKTCRSWNWVGFCRNHGHGGLSASPFPEGKIPAILTFPEIQRVDMNSC